MESELIPGTDWTWLVVIAIALIAGLLGGLINAVGVDNDSSVTDRPTLYRSLLLGVGAALLTPLFLEMMSSDLLAHVVDQDPETGTTKDLFVFFGFALLAGISSRAFIQTLSDRMLTSLRKEAEATERDLKAVIGTLSDDEEEALPADESQERAQSLTSEEQKVLEALQNEKYTLRTLGGIAGQARIARKELRGVIQGLVDEKLALEIKQDGKVLWGITPAGRKVWRVAARDSAVRSDAADPTGEHGEEGP